MRLQAVRNLERAFGARSEQGIMRIVAPTADEADRHAWPLPPVGQLRTLDAAAAERALAAAVDDRDLKVLYADAQNEAVTLLLRFMGPEQVVESIKQTLTVRSVVPVDPQTNQQMSDELRVHLVLIGELPRFDANRQEALRLMKRLHSALPFRTPAGVAPVLTNGFPGGIAWRVEVFSLAELQFSLLDHRDVDEHRWVRGEQHDAVRAAHGALEGLPALRAHDPVVRRLGLGAQALAGTASQYTLELVGTRAPPQGGAPHGDEQGSRARPLDRRRHGPLLAVYTVSETAGVDVSVRVVRMGA